MFSYTAKAARRNSRRGEDAFASCGDRPNPYKRSASVGRRPREMGVAMTYCCGILVREGLVMIADTRTNAGLDNISTFRKLQLFEDPGRHVMMLASSGNLSVSQGAVNLLVEGLEDPASGRVERLEDAQTMLQAAHLVGRAVRRSLALVGEIAETGVSFDVALLFGGQIGAAPPRLFMIYTAGNAIECTPDTPYLQIGEHKYGKPILDRAITYETDIYDALKIGLISMDLTIRSNLSVGLPIDIALMRRDALKTEVAYAHRRQRRLFPRSAPTLVQGVARGAYRHSAAALWPRVQMSEPQATPLLGVDDASLARAVEILRAGDSSPFRPRPSTALAPTPPRRARSPKFTPPRAARASIR